MKVEIKHDTFVRVSAGSTIDVTEAEAKRLKALNLASIVNEKPAEKPAKATKKK